MIRDAAVKRIQANVPGVPIVQHAVTAAVVSIAVQEGPVGYAQAGRRKLKPVTAHQRKVKLAAANAALQPRKAPGAAGHREVVGIAGNMGGSRRGDGS